MPVVEITTNRPAEEEPPPRPRARRWRRFVVKVTVALLVCLVAAELVARFYLGLGDPPLSVADDQVEYLFKPSQDVRRFGNRVAYNAYSMRSDEFPRAKADPRELRVLVIGDSVVNGGSQTDQGQLATSILQRRLSEKLERPVVVGNVSAGSWGPVNMSAYARKFGLFEADVVVVVLSSHDYGDAPTEPFTPVVGIQPQFPDRRPVLAVQELLMRYLLPRFRPTGDASVPVDRPPEQREVDRSLKAVRELVAQARSTGATVIVAQYLERGEQDGGLLPGHARIQSAAREAGAHIVQLGPSFKLSIGRGEDPYRDALHPNATGQRLIADVLFDAILGRVSAPPATTQSAPVGIGQ